MDDEFWKAREDWVEEAKQPWTWPRAAATIGRSLVFWLAIVALVYVVVRYG